MGLVASVITERLGYTFILGAYAAGAVCHIGLSGIAFMIIKSGITNVKVNERREKIPTIPF